MASSDALSVSNLTCGYHSSPVLKGVSLSFASGESTALLGPNGSGKSTLIKALSGQIKPSKGIIEVGGQTLANLSPKEIAKRIAVVPQEEYIPFRFSVREVVLMGRFAYTDGLFDLDEDIRIAEQALEFVDALQFADRPITELSGGERQRVLLARAITQQSQVILLDEPTTHLDVKHQVQVAQLIQRLVKDGKTVVVALHDLGSLSAIASRAVLMNLGKVEMVGSAEEILESKQLDRVYELEFERIKRGGRTIVLPPL